MSATTATREAHGIAPEGRRAHLRVVTDAPRDQEALRRSRGDQEALRLTRRGRAVLRILGWSFVLLAVALVVLLATLVLGGPADAGDQQGEAAVPVSEHIVLPGETLWGIASQWAPDEDPREEIARIVDLNALPGVGVHAGQTLYLPQGR